MGCGGELGEELMLEGGEREDAEVDFGGQKIAERKEWL